MRLVVALFIGSIALRPQLLAIGPLLPLIRDDLGLSAGPAGLLSTIPILCMGLLAPVGPRLAARLGTVRTLTVCLALIAGFGILRSLVPGYPLVLAATFGLGVGIGMAGAVPSMIVSERLPTRPALGTGAYAGGIVAGSAIAAAVAVPLAVDGAWRQALLVISLAAIVPAVAWSVLVRPGPAGHGVRPRPVRLPWRSRTAWLLVVVFGLQSTLYYAVSAWVPNLFVEHGWDPVAAGSLVAIINVAGLLTTLGVPLVADRLGTRREQLVASAAASTAGLLGIALAPDLGYGWVVMLGLGLGAIFPLVLTLPIDVSDDAAQVGAVAAFMLLGGYVLSSVGPVLLGVVRDATGDFATSLWLLVGIGIALCALCLTMSPGRLRAGVRRPPVTGARSTR